MSTAKDPEFWKNHANNLKQTEKQDSTTPSTEGEKGQVAPENVNLDFSAVESLEDMPPIMEVSESRPVDLADPMTEVNVSHSDMADSQNTTKNKPKGKLSMLKGLMDKMQNSMDKQLNKNETTANSSEQIEIKAVETTEQPKKEKPGPFSFLKKEKKAEKKSADKTADGIEDETKKKGGGLSTPKKVAILGAMAVASYFSMQEESKTNGPAQVNSANASIAAPVADATINEDPNNPLDLDLSGDGFESIDNEVNASTDFADAGFEPIQKSEAPPLPEDINEIDLNGFDEEFGQEVTNTLESSNAELGESIALQSVPGNNESDEEELPDIQMESAIGTQAEAKLLSSIETLNTSMTMMTQRIDEIAAQQKSNYERMERVEANISAIEETTLPIIKRMKENTLYRPHLEIIGLYQASPDCEECVAHAIFRHANTEVEVAKGSRWNGYTVFEISGDRLTLLSEANEIKYDYWVRR